MSGVLYGDWDAVLPKLKMVREAITEEVVQDLKKSGELFISRIRGHIRRQDFNFIPLSPATVRRKRSNKTNWWIHTGKFSKNLSITVVRIGKQVANIKAGASKRRRYDSRHTMFELAKKLEYGAGRIPGRPLFTSTLQGFDAEMRKLGPRARRRVETIWRMRI